MTIDTDIIAVLEETGNITDAMHIIATLSQRNAGSINARLNAMAKDGTILKMSHSTYRLPLRAEGDDEPAALWQNAKAAPFSRILDYIKHHDRAKRERMAKDMPEIKQLAAALSDMVKTKHIHHVGDQEYRLGPHPNAPAQRKPAHNWNDQSYRQPPAATNNPSEAEREDSAESTTVEPEAVATPIGAGDAPVESAAQESPPPVIGPAAAHEHEQHEENDTMNGIGSHRPQDPPPAPEAAAQQQSKFEHLEALQPGPLMVVPKPPQSQFNMNIDGLSVSIAGDPKAVMEAVAAIYQAREGAN